MKIVLAIAIMSACVFFGNEALKKSVNRKKYFEAFLAAVTDIGSGLAVNHRSVYEEMENRNGILKDMFDYICETHKGKRTVSLERVFKDFYDKDKKLCLYVTAEEYEIILRAFASTEYKNISEIQNTFAETRKYIKEKLDACNSVGIKKGKLIKKVAVLTGLIAVICLI